MRKTKKRKGTFAGSQDLEKFTQRTISAKIKVNAEEKLHRRVRGNDTCMMMGVSQETCYTVPRIRPARNGATCGLDEQSPISVTDSSHQGLDKNVPTDNGSMKVSSGLDKIRERKTTAVQNGGKGLKIIRTSRRTS